MEKKSSENQNYFPVATVDNEDVKLYQQGRWTEKEKIKYLVFLQVHSDKFVKSNKRLWKIYKALSGYVETRNPQQCRSHHRKLLLRYQSLQGIVENGKKYFSPELYQTEITFYKQSYLKNNCIERNYTRIPQVTTMELPSFSGQRQRQKNENLTFETVDQNRSSNFIKYENTQLLAQQNLQIWNSMQLAYMAIMVSNPFLTNPLMNYWYSF